MVFLWVCYRFGYFVCCRKFFAFIRMFPISFWLCSSAIQVAKVIKNEMCFPVFFILFENNY